MGQTIREIKDRIRALDGSHKVIKSMKVIATARLSPAQRLVMTYRPYVNHLKGVVQRVSEKQGADAPELMKRRFNFKRFDALVITSDQGLCGGFNENLMREMLDGYYEHIDHGIDVKLLVMGKKGMSFLRQHSIPFMSLPVKLKDISLAQMVAVEISELLCERFLSHECDGSYVIFNGFESVGVQRVRFWNLLPLHWRGEKRVRTSYIIEPSGSKALNKLCKSALEYTILLAILESKAAEEAARLMAMDVASKSADEMKGNLNLMYHRARQEAITMELLDIINGVRRT